MNGHFLFDRPFHPLKADTELIFEQFADRANAAVAEVVDIVLRIMFAVPFHSKQIVDHFDKVFRFEQRIVDAVLFGPAHLDVELQTADARKIESPCVKEHSLQQMVGGRYGRGIARTHLSIDLEQGIDRFRDRVFSQRVRDDLADRVVLWKEDRKAFDALFDYLLQLGRADLGVRFDYDLAGLEIDDVVYRERTLEISRCDLDLFFPEPTQISEC